MGGGRGGVKHNVKMTLFSANIVWISPLSDLPGAMVQHSEVHDTKRARTNTFLVLP